MPSARPRGGDRRRLPPWMAAPSLTASFAPPSSADGTAARSSSTTTGRGNRNKRRRKANDRARGGPDEAYLSAEAARAFRSDADAVAAHKERERKQAAADSLCPPVSYEIEGHVRALDLEACGMAMGEVDGCVVHALKYSTGEGGDYGRGGRRGAGGSVQDVSTLAEDVRRFLDKFQPVDDEDEEDDGEEEDASKRSNAFATGGDMRDVILRDMMHDKYHPLMLPLITIKCLPNVMDRIEMTRGLVEDLSGREVSPDPQRQQQQRQQQPQETQRERPPTPGARPPCPALLQSAAPLVRQGHLIAEVLSQCLSRDPEGNEFAAKLQRKRRRNGRDGGTLHAAVWSWTDSLVEWAGWTEHFSSIVVVLEDPENIPSPTLDSFFVSVASLRSDHGVPLSVVVVSLTPGGLGDRLSLLRAPALQGPAGVMARELHVAPPGVQLDLFFDRLFSGKCLPTFLWTDHRLLDHLQFLFQESDNSIVSLGRRLKAELRRYFSVPGAFASLLGCEKFVVPNESRIAWLFGDEQCRRVMSANAAPAAPSTAKQEEKCDSHILDLYRKMQVTYLCHQLCQRIHVIFDVPFSGKIGHAPSSKFCSGTRLKELLLLLGDVRRRVATWREISAAWSKQSASTASLYDKLNEYIVLVGTLASEEGPDPSTSRALIEEVAGWAARQFPARTKPGESPPVQPRRDVARSLYHPPPAALADCPLLRARSVAFRVFETRVMTLADWRGRYLAAVAEREGKDATGVNNEKAFFFAVSELVHCGFMRKLATGKRQEAYEKVAIVWGSGR